MKYHNVSGYNSDSAVDVNEANYISVTDLPLYGNLGKLLGYGTLFVMKGQEEAIINFSRINLHYTDTKCIFARAKTEEVLDELYAHRYNISEMLKSMLWDLADEIAEA